MERINKIASGMKKTMFCLVAPFLLGGAACSLLTSCDDFFEQESDDVMYADKDHLNNAVDSIYSVIGILDKLQALGDRTILLGEVRGDLVDLTEVASNDLRELAQFNASSDNVYNQPRDYYAVINNCNYFIKHVDLELKTNRNEYIFQKEYAAVKAIRAWTYLQLAINYGRVPFVTEPILTKEESEKDYPMYSIEDICRYFINDLASLSEEYNTSLPGYRAIRGVESRMLFFPLSIVRGDLYLWLASFSKNSNDYKQAALNYYQYIKERNGQNSTYAIGRGFTMWTPGSTNWTGWFGYGSYTGTITSESAAADAEVITMIAGDSIRAEGNYSELGNLFNSTDYNSYRASITPSKRIEEISEAQVNCVLSPNGRSVSYAPTNLSEHMTGDLRLYQVWSTGYTHDRATGDQIETQYIDKYPAYRQKRNIHIYRKRMVYLRMAEALNMAGYPHMAFVILQKGLDNKTMNTDVYPYYSKEDSINFISKFDFPITRYNAVTAENIISGVLSGTQNQIGIHTFGSGWTPMNEYYTFTDSVKADSIDTATGMQAVDPVTGDLLYKNVAVPLARQQQQVDSLIINESALEFSFEGMRYYDIMRYALRQDNPGQTMAEFIANRKGKNNTATMAGEIKNSLTNQQNWFLKWNGKIGF